MDDRLAPIAADNLDRLHAYAATSVFWEMEPALHRTIDCSDAKLEKEAWLLNRLIDYGQCGFTIVFDDGMRATVIYCSPDDAPGAQLMPTFPVSLDAQLISSLFMDPGLSGRGLESILLDAAIMDLTQRGFAAVEAFGLRTEIAFAETTEEIVDFVAQRDKIGLMGVDQLEGAGFQVVREHPVLPRLRLELPPVHDVLNEQAMDLLLREAEMVSPAQVS